MSQKAIIKALVSALALTGFVQATEVRSPLLSERGPLRYIFTKEKAAEDKIDISVFSAGYGRQADKAYSKHGFKTGELTQLYFGKSDFRLGEALANSYMSRFAEFYNPLVQVMKISPRATYTEKGMVLGTRIAYALGDDKGTIGLRASIPLRQIDIERRDQGSRDSEQLQDLVAKVSRRFGTSGALATQIPAYAWRADLVNALITNMDTRERVMRTPTGMEFGANEIGSSAGNKTVALGDGNAKKGIILSPEGFIPRRHVGVITTNINGQLSTAAALLALSPTDQNAYVLDETSDYSDFNTAEITTDVARRLSVQNQQANIWFTTGHSSVDGTDIDPQSTAAINNALALGFGGENTYEWLADRGWIFETSRQVGLGDMDLDFFYGFELSDEVNSEVFLGVRLPTSGNQDYINNPYRGRLGNAGHWELKLGGMLAYELADWANVKADASYSFVLSKVEQRSAMFSGAQVRNIGPRADATVDWGYFVGHLDFTFFHPKTNALSSVFGYEFYAKAKDNVKFKQSQITSWEGRKWDTTALSFGDNLYALDNAAAGRDTDSIAHRVRFETSYRFSNWFEVCCGGAYTFAGKNTPRESDVHCGMNVTF